MTKINTMLFNVIIGPIHQHPVRRATADTCAYFHLHQLPGVLHDGLEHNPSGLRVPREIMRCNTHIESLQITEDTFGSHFSVPLSAGAQIKP